jgi:hypothetical protein
MFTLFVLFTACIGLYWLEIGICMFSCGGVGEFLVEGGSCLYIITVPYTIYNFYFNECFEYFLKIILSLYNFYFQILFCNYLFCRR